MSAKQLSIWEACESWLFPIIMATMENTHASCRSPIMNTCYGIITKQNCCVSSHSSAWKPWKSRFRRELFLYARWCSCRTGWSVYWTRLAARIASWRPKSRSSRQPVGTTWIYSKSYATYMETSNQMGDIKVTPRRRDRSRGTDSLRIGHCTACNHHSIRTYIPKSVKSLREQR